MCVSILKCCVVDKQKFSLSDALFAHEQGSLNVCVSLEHGAFIMWLLFYYVQVNKVL